MDDGARSNGDKATPSTAAPPAAATGKDQDQTDNNPRRGSRRPTRGGESHSSATASSSKRATPVASAVAPAVERQRGRDVCGGIREVGRAAGGKVVVDEGLLEVVGTKKAAAEDEAAATMEAHDKTEVEAGATGDSQISDADARTVGCGARGGDGAVVKGIDAVANDSPTYGRWPATLDAQWAEVEFMLCHEVDCEESLQSTIEATEAGLIFMDKLEEKAQVRFPFE